LQLIATGLLAKEMLIDNIDQCFSMLRGVVCNSETGRAFVSDNGVKVTDAPSFVGSKPHFAWLKRQKPHE